MVVAARRREASCDQGRRKAAWAQRGGLAPLVLGALGARGSLHVHNVAAAWQRLDPEEANDVECSAPRTGDGEPSSLVLEATTGVFTAGLAFLRPSELPPSAVPKPVRFMPGRYADFSSWGSQTKPIREDPREAIPPPMAGGDLYR